jgi:hypothetical protein
MPVDLWGSKTRATGDQFRPLRGDIRSGFDPAALHLFGSVVGEDRCWWTGLPFPLGERPAGQVMRKADFVAEGQWAKLLGGNGCVTRAMSLRSAG